MDVGICRGSNPNPQNPSLMPCPLGHGDPLSYHVIIKETLKIELNKFQLPLKVSAYQKGATANI